MDAVEDIKGKLSIEDVVSEYVQLKRTGANYKGLSPWTSEKTPSFVVSPEKQIWHDFSSGRGGDMFSFVMEMEGLDFKGALELLARRANIDLSQYGRSGPGNSQLKERLYAVLETAAKFYQVQLSSHRATLEYVRRQRRFEKETILAFRLGYSPNTGTALIDYLSKRGFTAEEIQKAGLSAKRQRGAVDMFRGRLMVPLMDPQGRVIGFTARQMDDDPRAPKYINTPQTLLYDKSRHVFGLNLAKETIRITEVAVIAEGNLDVVASHQAGVKQVVATAGTALTEYQLKALAHFTPDIRLAFDEDRAGQAATERTIPIASKVGINLSIITIPAGKDPDELIRQDPKLWQAAINQHQYALDWLIDRYQHQLDLSSAKGKRQFSDILLPVVAQLQDSVEQDHYLATLAQLLAVSKDSLQRKLQQKGTPTPARALKTTTPRPVDNKAAAEYKKTQDRLLALIVHHPMFAHYLDAITPGMMLDTTAQHVLQQLKNHQAATPDATLPKTGEYDKILTVIYEALYKDLDDVELGYEAARLTGRLIEQYVKAKKTTLTRGLEGADDAQTQVLLQKVKELDALLKTTKET